MFNNKKLIYSNYYLFVQYLYIFYLEINKYYFYSKTSSRKYKDSYRFLNFYNNNEIVQYLPLFILHRKTYKHWWFKFNYTLSELNKKKFYKQSFYENKGRIKIFGRGWKIVRYSYLLLIKLGYSHMIFNCLLPIYKDKFKKKKKKYYTYYSIFYMNVNTLLGKFKSMRVPDVYTSKGIFHRKIIL
jgi:hypothetical protein